MLPTDVETIKRKINIKVSGYDKFVNFRDLTIHQAMNAHCTFEFFWRISPNIVTQAAEDFRHFRSFINADVMFSFYNPVANRDVLFKGVVSHLSVVNRDGAHAGYRVKGYSQTIATEDLRYSRQFLDCTLKEIFEETLKGQALGMWEQENISPKFQGRIAHSLQSNEHGWQYLTRLAANYGEWLYWDGTRLQLGQLRDAKTTLINGSHLKSFELSSDVVSNKLSLSVFDTNSASTARGSMDKTTDTFKDSLINTSIDAQSNLYTRKTRDLQRHEYASNATSMADIERMNKLYTSGRAVAMATYIAVSHIPINVGHIVTVNDRGIDHPLIVVESTISSVGIGNVTCRFVGIPLDSQYPPYTNPLLHGQAGTQPAIVKENNDPEGMGRVKVTYSWGRTDNESPWLRVQTPYAGAGKGFYFIPEVGEEVRVDFEGGNPDKAFVAAGHYNGRATSGYGDAGNAVKAIHTKSGTRIVFNDQEGSVHIEDASGTTWDMDGKGNLTVQVAGSFSVTAKNIVLNAQESISENAGAAINVSGGASVAISSGGTLAETAAKEYTLTAESVVKYANEITTYSDTHTTQASDEIVMNSEGNVTKQVKNELKVNSGEKSKLF
jgi:uncharacterized protein involved in type VI secretion and phage assembly